MSEAKLTKKQEEIFWIIYNTMESAGADHITSPKGTRRSWKTGEPQIAGDGVLKSLEEFGLITVVTVSESAWKYSGPSRTYYRIGLGPAAIDWIHGKKEVQKPCLKELNEDWYGGECPRHNTNHRRDEWNEQNRSTSSS